MRYPFAFTCLIILNVPSVVLAQASGCEQHLQKAVLFLDMSDYSAAGKQLDTAFAACPALPETQMEAYYLRGQLLALQSQHTDAMLEFAHAEEAMANVVGQDSLKAQIYFKMSRAAMRASQYVKGVAAIEKALDLQVALTGENSIEVLRLVRQYVELAINAPQMNPLPLMQRAQRIQASIPNADPDEAARAYLHWGMYYTHNEQHAMALEMFDRALAIPVANDTLNAKIKGMCHHTIGEYYQLTNDNRLAEAHFRKSLAYRVPYFGPQKEEVIWTWGSLARTFYPQGKYEETIMWADSFFHWADYDLKNLRKCRSMNYASKVMDHKIKATYQLCQQHPSGHYCTEALRLCEEAIVVNDFRMSKIDRHDLEARAAREMASTNATMAQILYAEHSDHTMELLFQITERSKGYLLNGAQAKKKAMRFARVPPDLIAAERELRKRVGETEKSLALKTANQNTDPTNLSELYDQLAVYYKRYDSLTAYIQTRYPDYFNLMLNRNVATIKSTQQLLDAEQSMLSYFVADTLLYVFLIDKEHYQVQRFPYTAALDQTIKAYRAAFFKYHTQPTYDDLYEECAATLAQSGYALFQQLVAPFEPNLKPHLIVVPDGLLGYLPFEAFLTAPTEKNTRFHTHAYLLQKYTISYTYSATLLAQMQERPSPPVLQHFLGVAPEFKGQNSSVRSPSEPQPTRMPPLLHNESEVRQIAALMEGTVLTSVQATKSVFGEQAQQYNIIHLATHAKATDQVGDYAFLAFSMPEGQAEETSNLYSKEVYSLPLQANMVVLSACETGIGELRRGEGIISLARAFMYAGAQSVVTTLWSVDDAKSVELMLDFYRYLKAGQPKDTALCLAKRNYLNKHKGEAAHPYYWAGYIGLGDMGALK